MNLYSKFSSDIALSSQNFDLSHFRSSLPELRECGGYVCFEGIVRNINNGKQVLGLEYEAYEDLAVSEIKRIAQEANLHFGIHYARVHHRVGPLSIGDTAVIIQILGGHRGECFEACRYVIDQLKIRAPIWKKEFYTDGTTDWTRCTHNQDATHSPHGAIGHDHVPHQVDHLSNPNTKGNPHPCYP